MSDLFSYSHLFEGWFTVKTVAIRCNNLFVAANLGKNSHTFDVISSSSGSEIGSVRLYKLLCCQWYSVLRCLAASFETLNSKIEGGIVTSLHPDSCQISCNGLLIVCVLSRNSRAVMYFDAQPKDQHHSVQIPSFLVKFDYWLHNQSVVWHIRIYRVDCCTLGMLYPEDISNEAILHTDNWNRN